MFEDFRKQAEQSEFGDDDLNELRPQPQNGEEKRFLGMTAVQRFIIAALLFVMTVLLGFLLLIVTSKVVLPFMG
jgi:hypothetical protein